MRAEYAVMTEEHPDPDALRRAGEILKNGGLVAFPTETVYGLGGNALDPEASARIYAAKGRPSDNPLIVHIADLADIGKIASDFPEGARRLAARYWPGPLTMILPKRDIVPDRTTGGLPSVAVRFPSSRIAQQLILEGGGFIAAPSANASGRPSPTTAAHVAEDLGDAIDMIIDGGPVPIGLESTIVDFTGDVPMILRPGFLNQQMLEEVLGEVQTDPGILKDDPQVRPKAPGMRYRHYAPKAPLSVVEGTPEAVTEAIRSLAGAALRQGKRTGILCAEESAESYRAVPDTDAEPVFARAGDPFPAQEAERPFLVRCIGSRDEEETIAHNLYAALRAFDADGVDVIYSEAYDTPHLGSAVMNRLIRAAGHTILQAGTVLADN